MFDVENTACCFLRKGAILFYLYNHIRQNHQEGNIFAESPPLDGLQQGYSMELDAVQSDKNARSRCPEQRVDAATDIVWQMMTIAHCHHLRYHKHKLLCFSAPIFYLPVNY